MRGEGDRITADDVIRMGLERKHYWERHGTGHWGYGVALDVLALERRVAALERTDHDAAPLASLGTGDTEEPVAFAVMSGGRAYDIYDTRGEAEAICRWLCEEESGDIWRVVPLVPCDATPPLHATSQECSVPPECTEPVAWAVENPAGDIHTIAYRRDRAEDYLASASERVVPLYRHPKPAITEAESAALYHGTAVLLWEGHTREEGSAASRNLLQIAAALKSLRERLAGGTK
jgi:hypothetical protein